MRTGIPLKITSAYLYCYLFLQSLNNISLNCANIKYSIAINKSYFSEEYSNISICSLKYNFKKEEKSDPDTGHFFPRFSSTGLKFTGMIHKSKDLSLENMKAQMVLLAGSDIFL